MDREQLLADGKSPQPQKSFLCWHSDEPAYQRLWWEHHEADMEQLAGLREWLDRLDKQVG